MYSKAEASQIKQEFWTAFGRYMAVHLSSEGLKVNWINYKTGFKFLQFKMMADTRKASIAIEINHSDPDLRELLYESLLELKILFQSYLNEEWEWEQYASDPYGRPVSRAYTGISPVNVLRQEDWPQIISFLKPRIMALDAFWNDVKDRFEEFKAF